MFYSVLRELRCRQIAVTHCIVQQAIVEPNVLHVGSAAAPQMLSITLLRAPTNGSAVSINLEVRQ
jgi:hypothetical protein